MVTTFVRAKGSEVLLSATGAWVLSEMIEDEKVAFVRTRRSYSAVEFERVLLPMLEVSRRRRDYGRFLVVDDSLHRREHAPLRGDPTPGLESGP